VWREHSEFAHYSSRKSKRSEDKIANDVKSDDSMSLRRSEAKCGEVLAVAPVGRDDSLNGSTGLWDFVSVSPFCYGVLTFPVFRK
jgi:hypothetical protein